MPRERIGEVELYWDLEGEGDEVVAFLNGVAMSVGSWQPQRDFFAGRYRCLFHDTRGQLLSAKPPGDYSLRMHADDLARLLDHLGIDRVHFVGTSYGSEIGMIFALAHPDRVRSLAVIAGVSEVGALTRAATDSWAEAARHDPTAFFRCMLPWVYSSAYLESHRELLAEREEAIRHLPPEFFEAFGRLVRAFTELDVTDELHRIACPTLVVSAELDLVKPPRYGELIHERIPDSELVVVPGAGHAVVVEQPDAVNRIVADFLDRVRSRPANRPG